MRIFSVFLLLTLFLACGSDSEPEAEAATPLEGRWELVEARRDNVKTGVLEGLYFVFADGGSFETNLLVDDAQTGTYERSGEEITTAGVEPAMTYEILALEDNRLILRSRYQGFLFDFDLHRAGEQRGLPTE